MKIFKMLFFLALIGSALTACSKDDEAKGMAGTWEGLWGFDQDIPSYYERWEFKKNGDFSAYDDDGDLYATGSFEVDGTVFSAEYTSKNSETKYRFAGTFDEATETIEGTWGLSPSVNNRGLFEMHKQ